MFEQFISVMEFRESTLVASSGTTVPQLPPVVETRSDLFLAPPGLPIPSVKPPTPGLKSVFLNPSLDFSQMKSGDERLRLILPAPVKAGNGPDASSLCLPSKRLP